MIVGLLCIIMFFFFSCSVCVKYFTVNVVRTAACTHTPADRTRTTTNIVCQSRTPILQMNVGHLNMKTKWKKSYSKKEIPYRTIEIETSSSSEAQENMRETENEYNVSIILNKDAYTQTHTRSSHRHTCTTRTEREQDQLKDRKDYTRWSIGSVWRAFSGYT